MKEFLPSLAFLIALPTSLIALSAMAQSPDNQSHPALVSGDNLMVTPAYISWDGRGRFTKKRYSISGDWSIMREGDETMIVFSDDFKTKNGPDLKIFLSQKPVSILTGNTVVGPDSLHISDLQSVRGKQAYIIPKDIDLTRYKSVVIHCEAYSVLWGGFDLPHA